MIDVSFPLYPQRDKLVIQTRATTVDFVPTFRITVLRTPACVWVASLVSTVKFVSINWVPEGSFFIFFYFFMQVARHTRPEGHFKVWATIIFVRGRCHLLLGLKQGYPFLSPYGCRLGYHQSEAWPVEQKALPPQFYVASVTTRIRTHTLLIKQQSLNPVLLTALP